MWKGLRGRMKTGLSFPVHSSFDYSFHENSGASKYLDIFVYIKMTMVIPVPNLFGMVIVSPSFVMEYYPTSKNNTVCERYTSKSSIIDNHKLSIISDARRY